MRNENYFKTKLQISKDNLTMAKSKLDHLDIQLRLLGERFEYDKKIYEDQIIHMQNTVTEMEKRIPNLEKKIEQGYSHVDLRTGKAYKSFNAIHEGQLKDKIAETIELQKASVEAHERKQALRTTKKNLKPEEKQIVEAEQIRESLQGPDEIAEIYARQQEDLKKKVEQYKLELEQSKAPKSVEPEVEFDTIGNEISIPIPIEPDMEVIIGEKKEIANEMRNVAVLMNGEAKELELLLVRHQDWIEQYQQEEGGKAVWQGRITNGFKNWCEDKSYKIGE